ncbi:hypothetical protein VNO78_23022 [Psophocarpus tetragonolobus]|uniref:Transmembrane protein n=1 Tax=Psophocarpus tetragonolobus TaxID=3891 RepID=A0AAN9XCS0_PSOTE
MNGQEGNDCVKEENGGVTRNWITCGIRRRMMDKSRDERCFHRIMQEREKHQHRTVSYPIQSITLTLSFFFFQILSFF